MAKQVVMNPVVMVRCRGVLRIDRIKAALRATQRRHPALQVKLVPGAEPWFSNRDVPPIPLRIVDRQGEEHWREVVRFELNSPFDATVGPLIRFVLVRDEQACELICVTDHLNADGRSGLFVLRDVLRMIDDPQLRLVPLRDRDSFDRYLPTGLWDMRMPDAIRGLWAERTRSALSRFDNVGSRVLGRDAEPALPQVPAPIEIVHRRLDPARTQALVEACRARGNTVLCALVVACAHALATVDSPRGKGVIGCVTPIDIRDLLSPSVGDDFGIFAWAPTSYHPLGPGAEFWGLAQRMRRIVRVYRSTPALAGMRRLLDFMEATEGTRFGGASGRAMRLLVDGMMVVSNLGRVTLPERVAGVEVESFGFFAMIPEVEFVLGVQSFRGVLELNYCCSRDWMRRSVIEGVADRVEAVLDAASGLPTRDSAEQLVFAGA